MIIFQHSAEPLTALHRVASVQIRRRRSGNETIAETLVVSLEVIVFDILRDHVPQVSFTKRNDPAQALSSNRPRTVPKLDRVKIKLPRDDSTSTLRRAAHGTSPGTRHLDGPGGQSRDENRTANSTSQHACPMLKSQTSTRGRD